MSDEVTDQHLDFILANAQAVDQNQVRTLNWSVATKSAKERGWGGSITMRADVSASHMEATDHLCRFFDHGARVMKKLVHLVRGARAERDAALARAEKAEADLQFLADQVGSAVVASSLAPGEHLAHKPGETRHAIVGVVEDLVARAHKAEAAAAAAGNITVCDCGVGSLCLVDEDGLCVSCGCDVIVVADRHSADIVVQLRQERDAAPSTARADAGAVSA